MAKATTTKATTKATTTANAQATAKATTKATTTANAQATTGTTVQATKGNTPGNNSHVIAKVLPNPKRPGSAAHARYAAYAVGITVAQAVQNGATREDIRWDAKRGHIVLQAPSNGGQ